MDEYLLPAPRVEVLIFHKYKQGFYLHELVEAAFINVVSKSGEVDQVLPRSAAVDARSALRSGHLISETSGYPMVVLVEQDDITAKVVQSYKRLFFEGGVWK